MFPLSKSVPRYKESIILCCVDKYCASKETITRNKIAREINDNKKIKSLIFSNTKDFILSLYLVTVYQKLNFIKKHMFKNGLKRKVEYGNN